MQNPELLHDSMNSKLAMPRSPTYSSGINAYKNSKRKQQEPFLYSHMGGSLDAPENTMDSFLNSMLEGVDIIQCDVRMTKDGEVILCHDDTF